MVKGLDGNVSNTVDFGGGDVKVDISKKDLIKIKEHIKSHRYTNKTALKLDCGTKNPVRLVLQAHNPSVEKSKKNGNDEDVV